MCTAPFHGRKVQEKKTSAPPPKLSKSVATTSVFQSTHPNEAVYAPKLMWWQISRFNFKSEKEMVISPSSGELRKQRA